MWSNRLIIVSEDLSVKEMAFAYPFAVPGFKFYAQQILLTVRRYHFTMKMSQTYKS